MQSQLTLVITINHDENIPDAQSIQQMLTGELAKRLGLIGGTKWSRVLKTFGRYARVGSEAKGVSSFLQSAFIESRKQGKPVGIGQVGEVKLAE